MIIKKSRVLFWFLPKWVDGITLFKKIYVPYNRTPSKRLLTHEYIHVKQQMYFGIWKFYFLYFMCWLKNLIKMRDTKKAYKAIPFEEQAYRLQSKYQNLF